MKKYLIAFFTLYGITILSFAQTSSTSPVSVVIPVPTPSAFTIALQSILQLWYWDPTLTSNQWSQITNPLIVQNNYVGGYKIPVSTLKGHYALLSISPFGDGCKFGPNPATTASAVIFDIGTNRTSPVHVVINYYDINMLFQNTLLDAASLPPGHYRLHLNNLVTTLAGGGLYYLQVKYDGVQMYLIKMNT